MTPTMILILTLAAVLFVWSVLVVCAWALVHGAEKVERSRRGAE